MRTSCSAKSSVGVVSIYHSRSPRSGHAPGLVPRQFPLKTFLRLIPKRIMNARENDYDAVSRVHSPRSYSRIVCRLAALDVADHQIPAPETGKDSSGHACAAKL